MDYKDKYIKYKKKYLKKKRINQMGGVQIDLDGWSEITDKKIISNL